MYTNGTGGTHMVAQTLKKMADEKVRSPTGNIGEHDATRPTRDPPHATPQNSSPTSRTTFITHQTHHITRPRSIHHVSYIHMSTQPSGGDLRRVNS